MVVPVIALVGDTVVKPMNSEGPEFVPAQELAQAPKGWDGRPVLPDHPNNGRSSANEPHTLESYSFGRLFNTRFEDNKLKTEAWLDPEKAQRVGEKATDVIETLRAGDMVEVSVGAWVSTEKRSGVHNGRRYEYVWRGVVGDHLAMGLGGAEGACSIEDGCGAPRANKGTTKQAELRTLFDGDDSPSTVDDAPASLRRAIAARTLLGKPGAETFGDLAFFPVVNPSTGKLNEGALRAVIGGRGSQADIPDAAKESAQEMARQLLNSEFDADLEVAKMATIDTSVNVTLKPTKLLQRLLAPLGAWRVNQDDDGLSDADLRESLWNALRAEEPGFDGIVEVFPDTNTVIYVTAPESELLWFRRTFAVDDEGAVSLNDDREQVEPVTKYEPVAASGGQGNNPAEGGEQVNARTVAKGVNSMSNENMDALKKRLYDCKRCPFTEADAATLEAFTEESLTALAEFYAKQPEPQDIKTEEPKSEPIAAKADIEANKKEDMKTEELSREEWLARAPEDIRTLVSRYNAEETARRKELVAALGSTQEEFTKEQLESKPTEELVALSRLLKLGEPKPDYSSRGLPVSSDDATSFEPPDTYGLNKKEAN
jgi:hypothetical protein